jgi:hypothetical protein
MHEIALPPLPKDCPLGLYKRSPARRLQIAHIVLVLPSVYLCPRLGSAGSEVLRVVDWPLNLKLHGGAEGAVDVRCEFHAVTP